MPFHVVNLDRYSSPPAGRIPDDMRYDWKIDKAPSNWSVTEEGSVVNEKWANGKADMMVRYDNPIDLNFCDVYEFKPFGQTYSPSYDLLHTSQLNGYLSGIDDDPTIPCHSRPGMSWVPAVYPAWKIVPREYTWGLGDLGVDLQITTKCDINGIFGISVADQRCGLVYYRFMWDDQKNKRMAREVDLRSTIAFQVLNGWIAQNFTEKAVEQEAAGEDVWELVAKGEVTMDGYDAFQEFIDIRLPDGTVDPDVWGVRVVDNYIAFMQDVAKQMDAQEGWIYKAWRYVSGTVKNIVHLIPLPGGGKPPASGCNVDNPMGEKRLPLCG